MRPTSSYFHFIFNDKGLSAWNLSFFMKLAWQVVHGQKNQEETGKLCWEIRVTYPVLPEKKYEVVFIFPFLRCTKVA